MTRTAKLATVFALIAGAAGPSLAVPRHHAHPVVSHIGPGCTGPAEAFLACHAKLPGVHTTPSGLQYQIIVPGAGGKPTTDDIVTVNYTGTLTTGAPFDQGVKSDFPVSGVVPGFAEGLQLMPLGAKYRFWIPPLLAYGDASPTPVIPPHSVLVFEVDLLTFRNKAADGPEQE